jgi:ElaB/YqjD/DUF883 family membrane-anchored ribosome-binding protein
MKINTESTTPSDLLNDLKNLVTEAEKMMGESITEHTAAAVDTLRSRFESAHARLAELSADVKKQVVAGARCTDQTIRANPYQSLAIAAGVGVLVGVLIGRRNR